MNRDSSAHTTRAENRPDRKLRLGPGIKLVAGLASQNFLKGTCMVRVGSPEPGTKTNFLIKPLKSNQLLTFNSNYHINTRSKTLYKDLAEELTRATDNRFIANPFQCYATARIVASE